MVQTHAFRERRNAIAAWLRDRYGDTVNDDDGFVPDAYYWKDAADLIKFLTANGFIITQTQENQ